MIANAPTSAPTDQGPPAGSRLDPAILRIIEALAEADVERDYAAALAKEPIDGR
jgi:hypothetical protein